MTSNYLKIAWRSIQKNKFFSALNILGLSISLGIALLLIGFVWKEFSFDRMYSKVDQIYRVNMKTSVEYLQERWVALPNSVGPAMKEEVPGVESFARLVRDDFGANASIQIGDQAFVEKGIYLADSAIFSMFDFQFIEGDQANVFHDKKSIVISKSTKTKLFGNKPALDQLIYLNQRDTLRVSGVYEDLAENSTLDCEMIYNIMDSWMGKNVYWSNASYETYVQLSPTAHPAQVEKLASALIDKHVDKDDQYFTEFGLQPLSKVHLYSSDFRPGYTTRIGDIKTVRNLMYLAGMILLIACINYMNLATARTSTYAKEVGVNKVLGASRGQIRTRFYLETLLISLIAVFIGYGICLIGVPFFNRITGADLHFSDFFSPVILATILLCWGSITLLAGSFPALYLSSISSLNLMGKGKSKNSSIVEPARKALVVFQFTSSIILIISVIIMIQQMRYIENRDIGYQPDKLLAVSIKSIKSQQNFNALTNSINELPGTLSTVAVQAIPGTGESGKSLHKPTDGNSAGLPTFANVTNGPIVKTLGLKLLAGSDLPATLSPTDTVNYVLINEVDFAYLGYKTPADAVGQFIKTESSNKSIIQGVVANFNFRSLKESVGGYYFNRINKANERPRQLLIRYQEDSNAGYLQQVEQAFKKFAPDVAFDYTYVDTVVQKQYEEERRTNQVIITFSILTIGIACLGLLGLAAFTAEQRSKEIGIRKVLGASVFSISKMLTSGYFKLILIAFMIASPIAWYAMNEWLSNFVFRIDIPWWSFGIAALITFLITGLTISFQTIKAAIANPVDSLRDE